MNILIWRESFENIRIREKFVLFITTRLQKNTLISKCYYSSLLQQYKAVGPIKN